VVRSLVLVFVFVALASRDVRGQYNVPPATTHDTRSLEEPCLTDMCWCGREQCSSFVPAPPSLDGSELGASVDLLDTSKGTPVGHLDPLDLAVFRIHGLVNIGQRTELFAGLDLLLRQPSSMHEPRWQRQLVGMRARATRRVAGYARVQWGPGLDDDGHWGQGEAAVQLGLPVPRFFLSWDSALGGTYTQSATVADRTVHLGELFAQTGYVVRAPYSNGRRALGGWWSLAVHVPVIDLRDGHDPEWRLEISQGLLFGLGSGLDVFVEMVLFGRGDHDDPMTMLPNLTDGFSQVRWRVGFNQRFGTRRIPRSR
jgi:hypothetical protein